MNRRPAVELNAKTPSDRFQNWSFGWKPKHGDATHAAHILMKDNHFIQTPFYYSLSVLTSMAQRSYLYQRLRKARLAVVTKVGLKAWLYSALLNRYSTVNLPSSYSDSCDKFSWSKHNTISRTKLTSTCSVVMERWYSSPRMVVTIPFWHYRRLHKPWLKREWLHWLEKSTERGKSLVLNHVSIFSGQDT